MGKNRSSRNAGLSTFILISIVFLFGIIINYSIRDIVAITPTYQRVWFIAFLIVMYIVHIVIHELGHLVFGLLTGYEFSSFRIFSLMWIKQDGRIKLKRYRIAGTGGQCLMVPPEIKDGRLPYVLYNFGGVILNLAVSIPFAVGYAFWDKAPFLSLSFIAVFLIGIFNVLVNGIPLRGSINNDADTVLDISKSYEALEAFWVQLKINELLSVGVRIKDMPSEWFRVPTDEAMKNSVVTTRGVYACNRLVDEESFEEAEMLITHMLELDSGITDLHRYLLACDRIYLELIGKRRPGIVEELFTKKQERFMRSMDSLPAVLRTEYALALIYEKDFDKAQYVRRRFEKIAKKYPHPQDAEFERKLINIAQAQGLSQNS